MRCFVLTACFRVVSTCLVLFAVLSSGGCSSTSVKLNDGLINRLNNRGPVALSADNPYLAANLLVSREMEKSPEIQGFVRHRGAPAAIEVQKDYFAPLMLSFYYPENREYFALEEADGTWIIRGPIVVQREKFKEVARITRTLQGSPAIRFPNDALPQSSEPFGGDAQDTERESTSAPVLPPNETKESAQQGRSDDPFIARLRAYEKAQERLRKKESEKEQPAFTSFKSSNSGSRSSAPSSLEQIIQTHGKYEAEITPKGDLVHYVTYDGETLSMIARWYTRDRENARRLARINKMSNPNELNLGDIVVIPSYLVKNKFRMSEEALTALIKFVQRQPR